MKNGPIALSGNVYDRREDTQDGPGVDMIPATADTPEDQLIEVMGVRYALVPADPKESGFVAGDVALYNKLNMEGRMAIRGRHANYGYSGYFKASVHDGKSWRNFKIWDFVPEAERNYATQYEKRDVQARLTVRLRAMAGQMLRYGNRTYELENPPSAPAVEAGPAPLRLYRAVERSRFDPARAYARQSTARLPSNVPYVVDNLWEALRPEGMPSRRHAAYASPTPELALANASSGPADRDAYVVCELVLEPGSARVAQLAHGDTDARHHADLRVLQRLVTSTLGDAFFAKPLVERAGVAMLFMPGLAATELRALATNIPEIGAVLQAAEKASTFWTSLTDSPKSESDGELFFEMLEGHSYKLMPVVDADGSES